MSGRFITLEGGEGAGKSTQVVRLATWLRSLGIDVVTTREPGGSPRAEALREVILSGKAKVLGPLAEAVLFASARADHLDRTIRPALARGAWVVCDRFADSTRAYQGAAAHGDAEAILALEQAVVGATRLDLTLMIDLPPDIGLARAAARRGLGATDRFEAEDLTFHTALREAFLDIARTEPSRCVVIDGRGSVDDVESAIRTAIIARLLPAGAPEMSDGA